MHAASLFAELSDGLAKQGKAASRILLLGQTLFGLAIEQT